MSSNNTDDMDKCIAFGTNMVTQVMTTCGSSMTAVGIQAIINDMLKVNSGDVALRTKVFNEFMLTVPTEEKEKVKKSKKIDDVKTTKEARALKAKETRSANVKLAKQTRENAAKAETLKKLIRPKNVTRDATACKCCRDLHYGSRDLCSECIKMANESCSEPCYSDHESDHD